MAYPGSVLSHESDLSQGAALGDKAAALSAFSRSTLAEARPLELRQRF